MMGNTPVALKHFLCLMDPTNTKKHDQDHKGHQTSQFFNSIPEAQLMKIRILHAEAHSKPLNSVSPFVIAKMLEQVIDRTYSAKKLSTGDIHIEAQSMQQSSTLLSVKQISDVPVLISTLCTSDTFTGVICSEKLLQFFESEIEEDLKDKGIIGARRMSIRGDNKGIQIKHIMLSFKLHALQVEIKAGHVNCQV